MKIMPDNKKLLYSGRIDWGNPEEPVFVYPCTSVKIRYTGSFLRVCVRNKSAYWDNYLGCIADGKHLAFLLPKDGTASFDIGTGSTTGNEHTVMLFKRQDSCHEMSILWFETSDDGEILGLPEKPLRKIEVYGDSVSAGEVSEAVKYTGKEDPVHNGEYSNSWYSYAWLTARRLDAQIHDIAQGGIALLDNTGWFNEPEYMGMESIWDKTRYNPAFGSPSAWDFTKYIPHVVIVAFGQNDSNPEDYMKEDYNGSKAVKWRTHYRAFLAGLRKKYPEAYIICCTTILEHDVSWDNAIEEVVASAGDSRISHYMFKRNGCGTPGHIRVQEAGEMAGEMCKYIESLGIGW